MANEAYDVNKMPEKNPLSLQIDLKKFEKATEDEKKQADIMSESTSFFRDGMKRLRRNPLAMMSIVVLVIIIAMIIVVPSVVPYSYSDIITVNGKRDKTATNMSPFTYSKLEQQYIDEGVIGVLYGSVAGYFGGKVDLIMMRIVDVIYSLPDLLMIILLSVVLNEVINVSGNSLLGRLGTNMISLFLVFGLLYWVGMARLVRGQILTIKQNEYVLAARVSGAGSGRIIRRHILPNCISVIIISAALQIPSAIFTESFLSFISLGVKAPMPSLGSLANAARSGVTTYTYKLIFPAVMIALITLAFNLLGDGLRDAFDPKLRR